MNLQMRREETKGGKQKKLRLAACQRLIPSKQHTRPEKDKRLENTHAGKGALESRTKLDNVVVVATCFIQATVLT